MDVLIPLGTILLLVTATLLLAFGLFSAPWQFLLLVLVVGLLGIRKLMELNHLTGIPQEDGGEFPEAASTQSGSLAKAATEATSLTYRGAHYNPASTDAIAQSQPPEVSGKYRGGIWKKSPLTETPAANPPKSITGKYRGCAWKSES